MIKPQSGDNLSSSNSETSFNRFDESYKNMTDVGQVDSQIQVPKDGRLGAGVSLSQVQTNSNNRPVDTASPKRGPKVDMSQESSGKISNKHLENLKKLKEAKSFNPTNINQIQSKDQYPSGGAWTSRQEPLTLTNSRQSQNRSPLGQQSYTGINILKRPQRSTNSVNPFELQDHTIRGSRVRASSQLGYNKGEEGDTIQTLKDIIAGDHRAIKNMFWKGNNNGDSYDNLTDSQFNPEHAGLPGMESSSLTITPSQRSARKPQMLTAHAFTYNHERMVKQIGPEAPHFLSKQPITTAPQVGGDPDDDQTLKVPKKPHYMRMTETMQIKKVYIGKGQNLAMPSKNSKMQAKALSQQSQSDEAGGSGVDEISSKMSAASKFKSAVSSDGQPTNRNHQIYPIDEAPESFWENLPEPENQYNPRRPVSASRDNEKSSFSPGRGVQKILESEMSERASSVGRSRPNYLKGIRNKKKRHSPIRDNKDPSVKSNSARGRSPSANSEATKGAGNNSQSSMMQKSYSQRKVGIGRLQPYQCDQIHVPAEKPNLNKVNVRIQKDATLKEIKQAIYGDEKQDSSTIFDEELAALPMNKEQLKQALFQLQYLPDLKRKTQVEKTHKVLVFDAVLQSEAEKDQQLLDNIWLYLNPNGATTIQRPHVASFMNMILTNAHKHSDEVLSHKIAAWMLDFLNLQHGLQLKHDAVPDEGPPGKLDPEFSTIEEEPETRAKGIFAQYQQASQRQIKIASKKAHGKGNLSLINEYLGQNYFGTAMTVQKFATCIRYDNTKAVAQKKWLQADPKRSLSAMQNLSNQQTKKALALVPKDKRLYKEELVKDLLQVHTFQPQLCKKSTKELAKNYEQKQLAAFKEVFDAKFPQQVPPPKGSIKISSKQDESQNLEFEAWTPNVLDNQSQHSGFSPQFENQTNGTQSKLENSKQAAKSARGPAAGPLTFKERYELTVFQRNQREKRLENERKLKEEQEKAKCTFSPKLTKMGKEVQRHFSAIKMKKVFNNGLKGIVQDAIDLKTQESKKPSRKELARMEWFMTMQGGDKPQETGMQQLAPANKEQKRQEYKRRARARSQKKVGEEPESDQKGWLVKSHDLETIPEQVDKKPPGYDKVVERMRKHQKEQEQLKEKENKKSIGENYNQSRQKMLKGIDPLDQQELQKLKDQRKLDKLNNPIRKVDNEKADVLKGSVELNTTLKQFEKKGGAPMFAKNLALALGLDKKKIKVKQIREGSVIVDYEITIDNDTPTKSEMIKRQDQILQDGLVDLGGPIVIKTNKPKNQINKDVNKPLKSQRKFSEEPQVINHVLMRIDVGITPIKTAQVLIRDGDDPKDLASKFCKRHQLDTQMQSALEQQLKEHIDKYNKTKTKDNQNEDLQDIDDIKTINQQNKAESDANFDDKIAQFNEQVEKLEKQLENNANASDKIEKVLDLSHVSEEQIEEQELVSPIENVEDAEIFGSLPDDTTLKEAKPQSSQENNSRNLNFQSRNPSQADPRSQESSMLLKKFPQSEDKSIKITLDEAFDQVSKNEDQSNNFWEDLLKRKKMEQGVSPPRNEGLESRTQSMNDTSPVQEDFPESNVVVDVFKDKYQQREDELEKVEMLKKKWNLKNKYNAETSKQKREKRTRRFADNSDILDIKIEDNDKKQEEEKTQQKGQSSSDDDSEVLMRPYKLTKIEEQIATITESQEIKRREVDKSGLNNTADDNLPQAHTTKYASKMAKRYIVNKPGQKSQETSELNKSKSSKHDETFGTQISSNTKQSKKSQHKFKQT